jgi:hypothetical protein
MKAPWSVQIAWTLIVVMTGFWLWFGMASASSEGLGPRNWAAHLLMPGGLFMLIAAVAWRWRVTGAVLLIAAGLAVAAGYPLTMGHRVPPAAIVLVLLTLAVPALTAGLLLLDSRGTPAH